MPSAITSRVPKRSCSAASSAFQVPKKSSLWERLRPMSVAALTSTRVVDIVAT
jgi:hypothetical protein